MAPLREVQPHDDTSNVLYSPAAGTSHPLRPSRRGAHICRAEYSSRLRASPATGSDRARDRHWFHRGWRTGSHAPNTVEGAIASLAAEPPRSAVTYPHAARPVRPLRHELRAIPGHGAAASGGSSGPNGRGVQCTRSSMAQLLANGDLARMAA